MMKPFSMMTDSHNWDTMLDLSVLNAGFAQDDDRWNYGPISSSFFRLYWVTEGQATVRIGQVHTLQPGYLYLIPSFTTHYDCSRGIFRHVYIHLADNQNSLLNLLQKYPIPFGVKGKAWTGQLVHRLLELLPGISLADSVPDSYSSDTTTLASINRFASYPVGVQMEVRGILQQLLACFLNEAKEVAPVSDSRISSALIFIEKNLQSSIDIPMLARNALLSEEQFIRVFNRTMHDTPIRYIMRRKIFRAQVLLASGHHSIKEVSALVGYADANYFGRVFKKITGLTPREFLLQNR
jgi:AraC-like DNA-binding protein